MFGEWKKKKTTIKIIAAIASVIGPVLLLTLIVGALVLPLLLFVDKIGSIFNPDGSISRKNNFETAILEKEEEYLEKGVCIDKELILSVLLYGKSYDFDSDYVIEEDIDEIDSDIEIEDDSENSIGQPGTITEREKRALVKNAKKLADGMVKKMYSYYCTHYEDKKKLVCEDQSVSYNSNPFTPNNYLLQIDIPIDAGGGAGGRGTPCNGNPFHYDTERIESDPTFCGTEKQPQTEQLEYCKNICEPNYTVEEKIVYYRKTKEEFKTWLKLKWYQKDEYGHYGYDLEAKLKALGFSFPHDEDEKERILDEALDEIYTYYDIVKQPMCGGKGGGFADCGNMEDPYNGDYTQWNQKDPAWSEVPYGTTGHTLGEWGCPAVAAAILIQLSGTEVDYTALGSDSFNPGSFTCALNQLGGIGSGGFSWAGPTLVAPNFIHYESGGGNVWNRVKTLVEGGFYVIVHTTKSSSGTHWLAVTDYIENGSGGDFKIIDFGTNLTYRQKYGFNMNEYHAYRKAD